MMNINITGDMIATVIVGLTTIGVIAFTHFRNDQKFDKLRDNLSLLAQSFNRWIGYYQGSSHAKLDLSNTIGEGEKNTFSFPVANDLTSSNSPLTLKKRGVMLAKKLRAQALVDKYVDRLYHLVPNDAHKLQIQETCQGFVATQLMQIIEQKERAIISEAIYKEGGNPNEILPIYAILFRDAIFKKHNIDVPEYAN